MARNKSVDSHPRPQDSLPSSGLKGTFHRLKRKGNGWVVEELTVTENHLSVRELGDWDLRITTETRALDAMVRAAGD